VLIFLVNSLHKQNRFA